MQILSRNSSGFTLIELMAAMLIMLVGLLGMLKSVTVALEHNLKNHQREEVVSVAENIMNGMRTQPFAAVFTPTTTVTSKLRTGNGKYRVTRTVIAMSSGSKQYQVDVRSAFKNVSTTHSIISVRGVQ